MVMLQQMIVMFLMMAVGYLCYRKQILTEEVSKKVSAIVVNVANPCMILSSALTDQQMQGKELVQTFAIVVMMYAFLLAMAQLLPGILHIQKESRGAYAAMTVFANIGFMGFPVLAAMYGNGALLYGAVFQIPFNILIYTYGVAVLTRKPGACAKTEQDVNAEQDVKTEQDVKAEPNGKTGERQDAQGITAAVNGKSENKQSNNEQQGMMHREEDLQYRSDCLYRSNAALLSADSCSFLFTGIHNESGESHRSVKYDDYRRISCTNAVKGAVSG